LSLSKRGLFCGHAPNSALGATLTSRPELSREFVASHKRRRMIEAMADLCAERGYEATKIADVVARAAVARKTLYDNFGGKEELFLAALETTATAMRTAVCEACDGAGGGGAARVEAGLGAMLSFVAGNPAEARMCLVEALSATPAAAARYEEGMRDFVALLRRAAPRAPRQAETIEESLVGGVAWILQERLRQGRGAEVEELREELSQFLLSPYRGVENPGT
jgi:AcrR family transcriptional regulator